MQPGGIDFSRARMARVRQTRCWRPQRIATVELLSNVVLGFGKGTNLRKGEQHPPQVEAELCRLGSLAQEV